MPTPEHMLLMIEEGVAALPEILAPRNLHGFPAENKLRNEIAAPLKRLVKGGALDEEEHVVLARWLETIADHLSNVRKRFPRRYQNVCNLIGCAWMLLEDAGRMQSRMDLVRRSAT